MAQVAQAGGGIVISTGLAPALNGNYVLTGELVDGYPAFSAGAEAIVNEARALTRAAPDAAEGVQDPALELGRWRQAEVRVAGRKMVTPSRCPVIAKALAAVEAAVGAPVLFARVSSLAPPVHVRPHASETNGRWTLALGLVVPETESLELRFDDQARGLAEGRALLFDGSFTHELRHDGNREVITLEVDVPHPALAAGGRGAEL